MAKMKIDFKSIGLEVAGLTAGATAAKFVSNKAVHMLPASFSKFEKFFPVIPIVGGVILRRMDKKHGFLSELGAGMIAEGGSSLIAKHVPMLAGIDGEGWDKIGDKVDDILHNMLNDETAVVEETAVQHYQHNPENDDLGEIEDELGDDGLHNDLSNDLSDDGLHNDLSDDGLHNDLSDDGLHNDLSDDGLHNDMSGHYDELKTEM